MKGIQQFPDFITGLPEAALPFESAKGWFMTGEGRQVAFIEFPETVDVPEHSHKEQWEIVLAGSVRLVVNGQAAEYQAGDNFFIPAGAPHSARVQAGYKAVILFNEPGRYAAK